MNAPKVGDRVRVQYEGEVVHELDEDGDYGITPDGAVLPFFARAEHVTIIEPKFSEGDVVIDADHDVFQLGLNGEWLEMGCEMRWAFDYPTRPLRRLVPES